MERTNKIKVGTCKEWELIKAGIMSLRVVGLGKALLQECNPNSQGRYILDFMLSMEKLHVGSV